MKIVVHVHLDENGGLQAIEANAPGLDPGVEADNS